MKHLILPILLIGLLAPSCKKSADEQYGDDMAREHANDTTDPSAMASGEFADVETFNVVYHEMDDKPVYGFLARPKGSTDLPGLIVIQEWWGLNENIQTMAKKLAAEGYTALAVDMYGGEVADNPEKARELMMAASGDMDAARANLVAAHTYLTNTTGAPKVGTIGWCFGGGMSLQTALALPNDIDASVIYYGRLTEDKAEMATLDMPLILFFGDDEGEGAVAFGDSMKELGKDVSVNVYEGAKHAFANPTGQRYQKEAAEDSWAKTVSFFAEHLK